MCCTTPPCQYNSHVKNTSGTSTLCCNNDASTAGQVLISTAPPSQLQLWEDPQIAGRALSHSGPACAAAATAYSEPEIFLLRSEMSFSSSSRLDCGRKAWHSSIWYRAQVRVTSMRRLLFITFPLHLCSMHDAFWGWCHAGTLRGLLLCVGLATPHVSKPDGSACYATPSRSLPALHYPRCQSVN